jgi:hypothetical protein
MKSDAACRVSIEGEAAGLAACHTFVVSRRGEGVTDQDREIAVRPCNSGLQISFGEPPQVIDDGAGCVVVRVELSHEVGRVLRHDKIAEDQPSVRGEAIGAAPEELRLPSAVEVVDGKDRDDHVERTVGQRVFEARDAQLDTIGREYRARVFEYLAARVEPDKYGGWVAREHAPRGLAGARSELQDTSRVGAGGHDRLVLEALIVWHRIMHQREKPVGIPALKARHTDRLPRYVSGASCTTRRCLAAQ